MRSVDSLEELSAGIHMVVGMLHDLNQKPSGDRILDSYEHKGIATILRLISSEITDRHEEELDTELEQKSKERFDSVEYMRVEHIKSRAVALREFGISG